MLTHGCSRVSEFGRREAGFCGALVSQQFPTEFPRVGLGAQGFVQFGIDQSSSGGRCLIPREMFAHLSSLLDDSSKSGEAAWEGRPGNTLLEMILWRLHLPRGVSG